MIFTALWTLSLAPLTFVLSHMPVFTGPDTSGWAEGLGAFGGFLALAQGWLNVPILLVALGVVVGERLIWLGVSLVIWIYDHIPLKAT